MGLVFSNKGTDQQKLTLERKNVQRIVFVPLFLAVLSVVTVIITKKMDLFKLSNRLFIAMTLFAVSSVAFSCFAVQMLKRKSRKSELWLFQMFYLIANTGFLTYISYAYLKDTGSVLAYVLTVFFGACCLLYSRFEYILCVAIECVLPLVLYLEKTLQNSFRHMWRSK